MDIVVCYSAGEAWNAAHAGMIAIAPKVTPLNGSLVNVPMDSPLLAALRAHADFHELLKAPEDNKRNGFVSFSTCLHPADKETADTLLSIAESASVRAVPTST